MAKLTGGQEDLFFLGVAGIVLVIVLPPLARVLLRRCRKGGYAQRFAMWAFRPNIGKMERRGDAASLTKALVHRDRRVRAAAAETLSGGRIWMVAGTDLRRGLLALFRMDRGLEAIAEIGPAAVQMLVIAFTSFTPLLNGADLDALRRFAAAALARMGEPGIRALWDCRRVVGGAPRWSGALTIIEPLVAAGASQEVMESLLAATEDPDWREREAAVSGLAIVGQAAVEPLLAMLHGDDTSADGTLRGLAAKALGEIGNARAVPDLIAILPDRRGRVRERALQALGHIGDPTAVPSLSAYHAVRSLGAIRDPSATEALLSMLTDAPLEAGEVLAARGHSSGFKALLELARSDPDRAERAVAALRAALEAGAARISAENLRAVAHLDDVVYLANNPERIGVHGTVRQDLPAFVRARLDCSPERRLAHSELRRRGLQP